MTSKRASSNSLTISTYRCLLLIDALYGIIYHYRVNVQELLLKVLDIGFLARFEKLIY